MINLLQYKKQIILQGPPGTGKTKLAKELAETLLYGSDKITINEFRNRIFNGLEFKLKTNVSPIKIESFVDDVIYIRRNNREDSFSFHLNDLYNTYESGEWSDNKYADYQIYAKRSLARFIVEKYQENLYENNFRILQFHPSYTYEDFVRGIVAESKGDKVAYKNINRILGAFAKEALKNYLDSQKESGELSKEVQLKKYFDEFVESIEEELEQKEAITLTDNVSIIDVEEDAFRYKGSNGWTSLGNKMFFRDILQAYNDKNTTRQEIKHNSNLSGLAKQHSSYFIRVVNKFSTFLDTRKGNSSEAEIEKVALRNYVLIIDEINRANLSSVLGELIYALEYRGEAVESIYPVDGDNKLILPPNLYIIGTMNTADRSAERIDYAIRRRFAFVDVLPTSLADTDEIYFNKKGFENVAQLFNRNNVSHEFEIKDVQIGHSYFIAKKKDAINETKRDKIFALKMNYEVVPILLEYIRDGILVGKINDEDVKDYVNKLKATI